MSVQECGERRGKTSRFREAARSFRINHEFGVKRDRLCGTLIAMSVRGKMSARLSRISPDNNLYACMYTPRNYTLVSGSRVLRGTRASACVYKRNFSQSRNAPHLFATCYYRSHRSFALPDEGDFRRERRLNCDLYQKTQRAAWPLRRVYRDARRSHREAGLAAKSKVKEEITFLWRRRENRN